MAALQTCAGVTSVKALDQRSTMFERLVARLGLDHIAVGVPSAVPNQSFSQLYRMCYMTPAHQHISYCNLQPDYQYHTAYYNHLLAHLQPLWTGLKLQVSRKLLQ